MIDARLLLAIAAPLAIAAQQAPRYMPETGWRAPDGARWREAWFGEKLASMRLPSFVPDVAARGYRARFRMLVLPSFDQPYAISVDQRVGGRSTLRLTVTDGRGGYGGGKLILDETRPFPRDAAARLQAALDAARFDARVLEVRYPADEFGQPHPPSAVPPSPGCTDGTQIVFERRTAARHHVVSRHECLLDRETRALVETVLAVSGRTTDRREGYVLRPRVSAPTP